MGFNRVGHWNPLSEPCLRQAGVDGNDKIPPELRRAGIRMMIFNLPTLRYGINQWGLEEKDIEDIEDRRDDEDLRPDWIAVCLSAVRRAGIRMSFTWK